MHCTAQRLYHGTDRLYSTLVVHADLRLIWAGSLDVGDPFEAIRACTAVVAIPRSSNSNEVEVVVDLGVAAVFFFAVDEAGWLSRGLSFVQKGDRFSIGRVTAIWLRVHGWEEKEER